RGSRWRRLAGHVPTVVMSPAGGVGTSPEGRLSVGEIQVRLGSDGPVDSAWAALGGVYDPELCLDVVSLGLVYDVRDEGGAVVVEMTLTTPGCPASESLPEMARGAVSDALGSSVGVEMRVVWDPPWSPEMMSDDAGDALGFRSR
ncbi:MAG: metal-sulfur cluster assembly factor, partial [Acidimicrobiales bacterium]